MDKIGTFEKKFIDQYGRERIFNGINLCDKSVYSPEKTGYDEKYLDNLLKRFSDAGLNLIRLGFNWEMLEPEPGKYNDKYIDNIAMTLDLCEKYGIYVFLDMHQDLYSSVCGADGAPEWAVLTDGYKVKPYKFVWAEPYFWGKFCHAAFDNFWNNKKVNGKGLQDYYTDCWKYVVSKVKDKPALIGYDMMNEPFPGRDGGKVFRLIVKNGIKTALFDKEIKRGKAIRDLFSKDRVPKIMSQITFNIVRKVTTPCHELIRKFDTERYSPFLNKTAGEINKEDDDKIYFIENSYYSNLGIPFSTPTITVNGKRADKQVFAPHAYDFMVDTPFYKYASNERIAGIFAEHKKSQDRLNTPVVVGEWGGSGGTDNSAWLPHIDFLLNLFAKNKWSNTYWAYYDGFLDTPVMSVFSRPYPRAVAGNIEEYKYDINCKLFTLKFEQPEDIKNETVISAPGETVSVTVDGNTYDYTKNNTEIVIKTEPGTHYIEVQMK